MRTKFAKKNPPDELITIRFLAEMAGLSPSWISIKINEGSIPCRTIHNGNSRSVTAIHASDAKEFLLGRMAKLFNDGEEKAAKGIEKNLERLFGLEEAA